MRNLEKKYLLHGMSLPEVVREFNGVTESIGWETPFQGRKLRPGTLLNVLVCHFLAQPPAVQAKMVKEGMSRLNHMLEQEPPAWAAQLKGAQSAVDDSHESDDSPPPAPRSRTPKSRPRR